MVEELFEAAPCAMLLLDRPGRMLHSNAQIELLFGYPQAEILAQSIALLVPAILQHIPLTSSAHTGPLELLGRRKDGSEFPVEITLVSLPTTNVSQAWLDADTADKVRPAVWLIAISDITLRKQSAAETAEIYHHLLDHRLAEALNVAQKLHNGPLQELEGLNFILAALDSDVNALPEPVRLRLSPEVKQIRESVRQVAGQLRRVLPRASPCLPRCFWLNQRHSGHPQNLSSYIPNGNGGSYPG